MGFAWEFAFNRFSFSDLAKESIAFLITSCFETPRIYDSILIWSFCRLLMLIFNWFLYFNVMMGCFLGYFLGYFSLYTGQMG
jgi:hypothetical protein